MRSDDLPIVEPTMLLRDSLWEMTRARFGLVLVLDGRRPAGIVTDGDLRRALLADPDAMNRPIGAIMTRTPVTINENAKLVEAEQLMQERKIKALVVVDNAGAVTGILEIFSK